MNKGDFVGRPKLAEQKGRGIQKTLIAFKMAEKSAPPRPHYSIWSGDGARELGEVVSGTIKRRMIKGVPPARSIPGAFRQKATSDSGHFTVAAGA